MIQALLVLMLATVLPIGNTEQVRVHGVAWHRLPDGRAAMVVRFHVKPGWHMFWTNPGDSGAPPEVKAILPAGWKLGEPIWPRPRILDDDHETVFVHEGEWAWLLPIHSDSAGATPNFEVELQLKWMACQDACVVGRTSVRVAAPTGDLTPLPHQMDGGSYPTTLAAGDSAKVVDHVLHLDLADTGHGSATFLQGVDPGVDVVGSNPVACTVEQGRITLANDLRIRANNARGKPLAIHGLVLLGTKISDPCIAIRLPISDTNDPVQGQPSH